MNIFLHAFGSVEGAANFLIHSAHGCNSQHPESTLPQENSENVPMTI